MDCRAGSGREVGRIDAHSTQQQQQQQQQRRQDTRPSCIAPTCCLHHQAPHLFTVSTRLTTLDTAIVSNGMCGLPYRYVVSRVTTTAPGGATYVAGSGMAIIPGGRGEVPSTAVNTIKGCASSSGAKPPGGTRTGAKVGMGGDGMELGTWVVVHVRLRARDKVAARKQSA